MSYIIIAFKQYCYFAFDDNCWCICICNYIIVFEKFYRNDIVWFDKEELGEIRF